MKATELEKKWLLKVLNIHLNNYHNGKVKMGEKQLTHLFSWKDKCKEDLDK